MRSFQPCAHDCRSEALGEVAVSADGLWTSASGKMGTEGD